MKLHQLAKLCAFTTACFVVSDISYAATGGTGEITFNGKITASTCNSTIAGNGGTDIVTLPDVAASDFTGQTDGRTSFSITLTDCSLTGETTVSTYFEPDATNIDPSTGHLNNQDAAAAATGVSLQLLDGTSGDVIKAGDGSQINDSSYVKPTDGAATLPYYVEYYKMGSAVAAGKVLGKVTYSLMYK